MVDAHHQFRFVFGDLLCFPLQDNERLWKFDVKNDIGFYVGDEDSVKGGSVIYMPYSHSFLTRGNGHRVLISDIQLLQWYSQRRDIRRNPLPYSIAHNAIMDLLANRETPAARIDTPQLLITPAADHDGDSITPITPAVVQHAIPIPVPLLLAPNRPRPRTALLHVPPAASLRREGRERTTSWRTTAPWLQWPTTTRSGYTKKCKHFLMVLNYIKEQIVLGQIEARKIFGKLNTADMHTKPLRSSEFLCLAHKILG
jgi:hypothetical protein